MTFLVALNTAANSGRSRAQREAIERGFHRHGLAFSYVPGNSPQSVQDALAGWDMEGVTGVVAAGGDGTVFHVLNGLCAHSDERRPPLGVLPIGTGNAFARDLGLAPGDWSAGLALLARGKTRRIDLVEARCADTRFYCLNIIGLGFVVEAGQWAGRLKWLGRAAYTLGAVMAMARLRRHRLRLVVDGEAMDRDALFVEASNSRYTGTHFLIAPDAQLDDGLLDLTLLAPLSRLRLLRLFPTIYDGRHGDHEEVITAQAARVRIEAPAGLPLMVDGEFIGQSPVEIQCLPRALELFSATPGEPGP